MKRFLFILFIFSIISLAPICQASIVTPIKILLVPGHDNQVWGAQYGKMKEATMTLALATQIYNLLKNDKRFDVYITRDSKGYTKEFANYYPAQKNAILVFEQNAKKIMQSKIISGSFLQKQNIIHNSASEDGALRLYGFNKWANENKMDAVIHVHFNDYPRPSVWTMGIYKGFAIYIPDGQFVNSQESKKLATNIFMQLHTKYITSNYKPEKGGLVTDQKLIAIGANDTLLSSVRSVLIEYGYIYRFGNNIVRQKAYTDMANLTALGIKNYFFPK